MITRTSSQRILICIVAITRFAMKTGRYAVRLLLALAVVAGCASSKVTTREVLVTEKIPRPNRILVYNFAATPAEVPADSALAEQYSEHSAPQTPDQIETGRRLGAQIASELAADIRDMGLPAQAVPIGTQPQIDDIVIKGYL